jgi:hypothetical protein
MRKKHIIPLILMALAIFRLFNKPETITLLDVIISIAGVFFFWGIFIWGYDNPEARHDNKTKTPQ